MLQLGGNRSVTCQGITRRSLLQMGALSALGLNLPQLLAAEASQKTGRKDLNIILLWMGGGPSNMDTFDMKPAAPAEYRGDAFATMRGSWNREDRTGYKVIRARMKDGKPTGVYEDFMTGFVLDKDTVWGRPTGLAVAPDGALLISDDANGTIFRVTHAGAK